MTLGRFAAGFLAFYCLVAAATLAGYKPAPLPASILATAAPWPDYGAHGPGFIPPPTPEGPLIAYGYRLIAATEEEIGPDTAKPFTGNRMSCQSCHLDAGTHRHGVPLVGVFRTYPKFSPRSGREITLVERIDECMTRSMNGRRLPGESREMAALLAYLRFIGEPDAIHAPSPPAPPVAPDPVRGMAVFERTCAKCHEPDGLGRRRGMGYEVPPLWGPDSFNDGAGMDRFDRAVHFIWHNMPRGIDPANPELTLQEAWDVAALLQAMPRPRYEGR
jgi:thiosulfate dehydrogenase